ncbi:hypothetical protein B0H13DRAFT_1579893, partial [Mycena leptocephala]
MASITPTQPVLSATVGAMVVGLMVQQFLLGCIAALACTPTFCGSFGQQPRFVRCLVGGLLVLNTVEAAMDLHIIYRTLVTHYGQYFFFDLQTWTMWAEPGVTAAVGFLAHLFFTRRCLKFVKSSAVLVMLLFCQVSICFYKVKRFSELRKMPVPIYLWLISTAATDIIIAVILCFCLYRARTCVKRTKSVLMKLILSSLETSFCTTICAILNLIFVRSPTHPTGLSDELHSLIPQFSLCRLYTITVLFTVIQNNRLR